MLRSPEEAIKPQMFSTATVGQYLLVLIKVNEKFSLLIGQNLISLSYFWCPFFAFLISALDLRHDIFRPVSLFHVSIMFLIIEASDETL